MKKVLGFLVVVLVPLGASGQSVPDSSIAGTSARDVTAILIDQCVGCHGPAQKKGGLDLSWRVTALKGGKSGTAIVPGDPDESLLMQKVAEGEMPPKGALKPEQIAAVRAWVKAGAPYVSEPLSPRRAGSDWWSLRPIRAVTLSEMKVLGANANDLSRRVRSPIDAFIVTGLSARGLTLAPEADPATLIRRVTFDLTGLPPSPEEVDAFVVDAAKVPDAYEKLVDRLLASPGFGERWGRHWLDVVRFGESQGYETNLPRPGAWPYRDYVIRAFNRDTAFPRFVADQLAGDAAADRSDWLTQSATGFLVGGTHDIVGNQTLDGMLQQRADDLDDMITATGTTFLGLTIQCARCHDHKFDPIGQRDYYGFQAIFAGVNHAERTLATPEAANNQREAAKITSELTRIEERLDTVEPLARTDRDAAVRPMVNSRRNVDRFEPVRARMVRLTILATADGIEPCLDEVEVYRASTPAPGGSTNVALASAGGKATASSEYPDAPIHKIAHLNDGRVGNGRSWISRVPGKGTVTITWPEPATIDRVVWGRDREEAFRDRMVTTYSVEVALEPGRWQVVASSLDRIPYSTSGAAIQANIVDSGLSQEAARERTTLIARQTKLRKRQSELGSGLMVYAGTFSQPGPTHVLVRGDPMRKGVEVKPSGVAVIKPELTLDVKASEQERRIALARWIANPANPLPARVMVNRIWHYHFGRGIVATPSDFGFNGVPPSHPELLDWLASAYISSGWHQKPIHRLIVTSAVYRQSSRLDPRARDIDRDNRLSGRMVPRRLEAESLHDAILAVSGQLDTRMGGRGYNIWESNNNYVAVYKPRAELGADAFRRMVYQFKPRSQPDPTFTAFDCPDAALVTPRRNISTTALQALNLLNSRFVIQQANRFAKRIEVEAGSSPDLQARQGFRLAFGREPSPSELNAAVALIGAHGSAAFCRALYNANEFIYVP